MAIARPRRVAWITIFPLNSTHRMASWCCKYPMLRHTFLRNDATSLCFPTNDTATYFRRFASLVATPTAIASMMGLARLLPAGVSADRTEATLPPSVKPRVASHPIAPLQTLRRLSSSLRDLPSAYIPPRLSASSLSVSRRSPPHPRENPPPPPAWSSLQPRESRGTE